MLDNPLTIESMQKRIDELEAELKQTKSAIGSCVFCHGIYVHVTEVAGE